MYPPRSRRKPGFIVKIFLGKTGIFGTQCGDAIRYHHYITYECLFFFGGTSSSAFDPVWNEFRSCRLQGALHRVQRAGPYAGAPVLGFETAHCGDGDSSPTGEILLLETKQRAGGSYLLGFYHEQYMSA